MDMRSFIFGGDTDMKMEDIQRQRAIAAQLRRGAGGQAPSNVGEGLSHIGQLLGARRREGIANRAQSKINTPQVGQMQTPQRRPTGGYFGTGG